MTSLFKEIAKACEANPSEFIGYSSVEIDKMESFYDVKISGDLRSFFSEIGRSSGAIGFKGDLIPYSGYYAIKTPAGVSGHVATQLNFREELLKYGRPFGTGKPFLFSIEYETQYYFLRTRADEPLRGITPEDDYSELSTNPEILYHCDENDKTVRNTGMTLREYLRDRAVRVATKYEGSGEMIVI